MIFETTGPEETRAAARQVAALLRPGDLLVMNDSRVLPSRLLGHREGTGGAMELLLLEHLFHFHIPF